MRDLLSQAAVQQVREKEEKVTVLLWKLHAKCCEVFFFFLREWRNNYIFSFIHRKKEHTCCFIWLNVDQKVKSLCLWLT